MQKKLYKYRTTLAKNQFVDLKEIYSDWFGDERADLEMGRYSVPIQAVGGVLSGIMEELQGPELTNSLKIQDKFGAIMGNPLNKFTAFGGLKFKVVTIEVTHPALRDELKGALAEKIIANINREVGCDCCNALNVIPKR